ncbi:Arc family DNA-binding protein [Pseudaminobacter sp. NGMCC 1.201702]|uniref:Arc family DNA-binding protein n=1 Tax=Pseudaminobacter sp. NGMCC 1.201702 TaxID=3391825 RepID=UPI0039EE2D61
MAQDSKSRKLDQYIVRFPDGMRDELKELAAEHNRSLNAEIIARLAEFQEMDERLYGSILKNEQLSAEVSRLSKIEEQFDVIKSRFFDENHQLKPVLTVPADLLDRIKKAAKHNHRSVEGEVIATLEEAYPSPRLVTPFSDLKMFVLQWHSECWHPLDWDSWMRFRSGESVPRITDKMSEEHNYFVVLVFDEEDMLCNIIVHNYLTKEGCYVSAAFENFNEEDIRDYNRFMTAASATPDDEKRLNELRSKMNPAFLLPPSSIAKLRETLKDLAPENVLDTLLARVS